METVQVRNESLRGSTDLELDLARVSPISWRAIFAGAAVALLVYMALMSLGVALGGANLRGAIEGDDSWKGLGVGAAVWMTVVVLVSLFSGGYTSARVSGPLTIHVGRTQGLVVASLFFITMLTQVGAILGSIGAGVGSVVGVTAKNVGSLAQNPEVQQVVNRSLGDLNLRESPEVVIAGITTHAIRGDIAGAKTYLARQAGITPADAERRIEGIRQDLETTLKTVGAKVSDVIRTAGWASFFALLLGGAASMVGGGMGAALSLRRPLSRADAKAAGHSRAA
jgi:hypothetical protein